MSTTSRTTKCRHDQPTPPSPLFPRSRRTRRRQPISVTLPRRQKHLSSKDEQLDNLIDRQNHETTIVLPNNNSETFEVERRDRVEEEENEEEKWRFQAEILRAECNFLRIERDFSLKKMEKSRMKMENTLKSALQSLVSGKQKIFEGENVNTVLQEEIEGLADRLQKLRKSSSVKEDEAGKCSNFEQIPLELSDMNCLKEFKGLHESNIDKENSVSISRAENKSSGVGMKEYYVPSSASTSKPVECPDFSGFFARHLYQEPTEKKCSGQCKAIIRKIVEQVRTETDQWSQMQEMLVQVKVDMEELRLSRDFWEDRAHNSDYEIKSLKHIVEKWKEKALVYEIKANELQLELSVLKDKLRKSKGKQRQNRGDIILKNNDHIDENSLKGVQIEETEQNPRPVSLAKQLAKEKRMIFRRLKEKRGFSGNKGSINEISTDRRKIYENGLGVTVGSSRSALCDVGNSLAMARENGESFRRRESFRK